MVARFPELTSSGDVGLTVLHHAARVRPPPRPDLLMREADPPTADVPTETRRTRLWEISENLHCSIIGTCLSAAELRQILVRLEVKGADRASEHEMHILGVLAAGRRESGAKLLQKALDRRHRGAISQFAKAHDAAALTALWDEWAERGDIPGAYWAVLTHPASTNDVVKYVFGEVHMLSHLVGAANRADIRRLRQLEEENAALAIKLDRQQQHLREAFDTRDAALKRLNEMIVAQAADAEREAEPSLDGEETASRSLVVDLNRRLSSHAARTERLQQRLDAALAAFAEAQQSQQMLSSERDGLRQELDRINDLLAAESATPGYPLDLAGASILYVGGRPNQVPQLRALVERVGGRFAHHDGGIDDSASLLPGLASRSDVVCFPVDCVSHNSADAIKRLCGRIGKPYLPLRTASLTCLLSALTSIKQTDAVALTP